MVMPDHQSAPEPDVNMGPVLLVVTGTVTGVALIVMIARIWVRRVMLRQLGPDDWFMLGAMVSFLLKFKNPQHCLTEDRFCQ
jgi:hypothetical protein